MLQRLSCFEIRLCIEICETRRSQAINETILQALIQVNTMGHGSDNVGGLLATVEL